ncbi:hypothetical protein, partial [Vibrio cholerae]|uniref:hypothetical protein n=1 Tax=Vibrio cholerae TaxID=666 RepID=UPI003F651A38
FFFVDVEKEKVSSPRRWGCFPSTRLGWILGIVFPTQVGVFLKMALPPSDSFSLPHTGGGVSTCQPF